MLPRVVHKRTSQKKKIKKKRKKKEEEQTNDSHFCNDLQRGQKGVEKTIYFNLIAQLLRPPSFLNSPLIMILLQINDSLIFRLSENLGV
jgi:hypothetical protein